MFNTDKQHLAVNATSAQAPYPHESEANRSIYALAQQIDTLLHLHSVEDHAAVLGLIQVTTQRRMHEHQKQQQLAAQAAQAKAQAEARFGVHVNG